MLVLALFFEEDRLAPNGFVHYLTYYMIGPEPQPTIHLSLEIGMDMFNETDMADLAHPVRGWWLWCSSYLPGL